MEKLGALIVAVISAWFLACFFGLVAAWPVKWLWNYAATFAFNVPRLDFWHAWALLWLSAFLVKSSK